MESFSKDECKGLFVEQGLSLNKIAKLAKRSTKTLSDWSKSENWRQLRIDYLQHNNLFGLKVCKVCAASKSLSDFQIVKTVAKEKVYLNHRRECKECESYAVTQREKDRRAKDPEYAYKVSKKKYEKQIQSGWRRKHNVAYAIKNRSAINAYMRVYKKNNPVVRVIGSLRRRLHYVIKGTNKSAPMMELIGCSRDELRLHIESLFQPGMTWGNYVEWHIDHIKAFVEFSDIAQPIQQQEACHWSNLRPLWAVENIRNGQAAKYRIRFNRKAEKVLP